MTYTLKQLEDNFIIKVLSLGEGFSRNAINNPGFASSIREARGIIDLLNIKLDSSNIQVMQDKNSIYFQINVDDSEIEWKLQRLNNTEFDVIEFVNRKSKKQKEVVNRHIKYNPINNKVKLEGSKIFLTYRTVNDSECRISHSEILKIYDAYGINIITNIMSYKPEVVTFNQGSANVFAQDMLNKKYNTTKENTSLKINMKRKYLDVVDIDYEDEEVKYNGPRPLIISNNSLREMIPLEYASNEVEIKPLSKEEINELLDNEVFDILKQGLVRYTSNNGINRTQYSYNSKENKNFTYQLKQQHY